MITNYLKEYFKENNISQYEIERRTKIARSKINLSLNGKRKLTADELMKIAIAFDLDLNKIKGIIQTKWFPISSLRRLNCASPQFNLRI